MDNKVTRRGLLGGAAAAAGIAGAGWTLLPVHAEPTQRRARPLQNSKLTAALIGCGGMGRGNMGNAMGHGVKIAAVCDVDSGHMAAAANDVVKANQKAPAQIKDFRKLLERKDIDAVFICTPDHWHALPFVAACEAGKDIYCEKPISHDIHEGKAMVAAAHHFKRVVQIGTWQRSTKEFVDAVHYIRSGQLGKITNVRAWKTDGSRLGNNAPKAPPAGLDWDFWTGPAAMNAYTGANGHVNWRWFYNYGAGMTGDWGVHMMDICLLGMSKNTDLPMPEDVTCYGGKLAWPTDDRTAPDYQAAIMRFRNPDFVMHWETGRKGLDFGNNGPDMLDHGSEFVSADGSSLTVWRGGWVVRNPDGTPRKTEGDPAFTSYDHMQNWLDCIASRKLTRSNIASMYQTTSVCHLINVSYQANSTVHWSKEKNDLVGPVGRTASAYAREMRHKTPSGTWRLPMYTG